MEKKLLPCDYCLCAHCAKDGVVKRCCLEHNELHCPKKDEEQHCPDYESKDREDDE